MKKITMAIIIIGAIILGIGIGVVKHNIDDSNTIPTKQQFKNVYSEINTMNTNLTAMSQYYLSVWEYTNNNGKITKKEISGTINVDYNKFLKYTDNINQLEFDSANGSLSCLEAYYENSGINDNMKNKLRQMRVELERINPNDQEEKNIYTQLYGIYNELNDYYNTIIQPTGNLFEYKTIISDKAVKIQVGIGNLSKNNI